MPDTLSSRGPEVTEAELSELMRRATGGRTLQTAFGPAGVWLSLVPGNNWALIAVHEMRIYTEEG